MVNDPEFRKAADPILGKGSPFLVGPSFAKQFKANLTMDPSVLEWLKPALRKYGIES